jgi:hypothetical protein
MQLRHGHPRLLYTERFDIWHNARSCANSSKRLAGEDFCSGKTGFTHLPSNGFPACIYRFFATLLAKPGLDLSSVHAGS